MTLLEVLKATKAAGVRLQPNGGRLRYHGPRGAITPTLLQELAAHKPMLLAFLHLPEEVRQEVESKGYCLFHHRRLDEDILVVVDEETPVPERHAGLVSYTLHELALLAERPGNLEDIHRLKRLFSGRLESWEQWA